MRIRMLLLVLTAILTSATVGAQEMTALSCKDFRPTEQAIERFPNLVGACEGIVERDGELYGKFTAIVRRVRGTNVTLYLPATDHTFAINADPSQRVLIGGRKVRPRDLQRGQEIRIYLPVAEFAKPDIEDITLITEEDVLISVQVERVAALPTTASVWPAVGAAGILLLGTGYLLRRRRIGAAVSLPVLLAGLLLGAAPIADADNHTKTVQIPGRVTTVAIQSAVIVEAVNKETREIKVIDASGRRYSFVADDMVENFAQIEPRDRIIVEHLESVAVFVAPPGTPALGDAAAVELAPLGGKPGIKAAGTVMVRATVESLNVTDRIATIRGENGNVRTIKVADDVPLDLVEVGDEVRMRITEAIAISVRKANTN